jgi:hypothetical protein
VILNLAPHGARLIISTSKALFFIVFIGNDKIGSSCGSTTYRAAEGGTRYDTVCFAVRFL